MSDETGGPRAQPDRRREASPTSREGARDLEAAAAAVIDGIVAPRVRRIAAHLDAALVCPHGTARHACTCILRPTPRLPAYVNVSFFLCHDRRFRSGVLRYVLEIDPRVIEYEDQDVFVFPLRTVPEAQVTSWVEEKLAAFSRVRERLGAAIRRRRATAE